MAESSNQTVERFCQAFSRHNLDEIMDFFADDAEYQKVPIGPATCGKSAIRTALERFLSLAKSVDLKVLRQVADGATVMNERVDNFDLGAKKVALPTVGVFEVRGGKITLWRDYFDLGSGSKQLS